MANGEKDLVLEELENGVMRLILNDEKRKMGHAFVLAKILSKY